jgi:hypothetical protein
MTTFAPETNTSHPPQDSSRFAILDSRSLEDARQTVDADDELPPPALETGNTGAKVFAEDLLALLSHCYAHEVYGSIEIENLLACDATCRCLALAAIPRASEIRLFRKKHREAIENCLADILRQRAEQKLNEGFVAKVNHLNFGAEARRRLVTAMFIDSMEMDGE